MDLIGIDMALRDCRTVRITMKSAPIRALL